MAYERQGVFDDLNNACFAQMDRLVNANDAETIAREIERSKAVSQLAGNIIGNANNAINLMRLQAQEGANLGDRAVATPKMLKGHY